MKVLEFAQGTDEWRAARAGKVTASRIDAVLAKIASGEAAARRDYRAQIVAEILTARPQDDGYVNYEMQWGIDQEPMARSAYEVSRGLLIREVGFVIHPELERSGASPDGLLGKDGMCEIKCPKTATHLQWMWEGKVPAKHQPQMHWQMACTGRKWNDFVSYDPRLPEELQLFVVRLPRDEGRIRDIEREVEKFLSDVDAMLAKIKAIKK